MLAGCRGVLEGKSEVRSKEEITAVLCLGEKVAMDQVKLWKWPEVSGCRHMLRMMFGG